MVFSRTTLKGLPGWVNFRCRLLGEVGHYSMPIHTSCSPSRSPFSSDADTIEFFLTMADSSRSCGLVVQPTHAMVFLFAEDPAHYLRRFPPLPIVAPTSLAAGGGVGTSLRWFICADIILVSIKSSKPILCTVWVGIGWDFCSKICFCLEKPDSMGKKYGNNFRLLP